MKHTLILLTLALTVLSCSVKETPEFIRVSNIQVIETTSQHITLKADALFKNPNSIGGELQTDEIKVFVNGNDLATVSSEVFKVPAKAEFTIPLTTRIETKQLISDKNLSSLLGSFLNQSLDVQYKGDIKYKVLGFSHKYAIDKTETVKIKL